jgi:hypothetical protein
VDRPAGARTIDDLLEAVRRRIDRVEPGLRRAVDVVGGFEAWAALGLPVLRVRSAA